MVVVVVSGGGGGLDAAEKHSMLGNCLEGWLGWERRRRTRGGHSVSLDKVLTDAEFDNCARPMITWTTTIRFNRLLS